MDTLMDRIQQIEGVELDRLEVSTTLLVWTWNSLYQIIVASETEVVVQGGKFFPEATHAYVDGAMTRGSLVKTRWIGVGLPIELRVRGQLIVTSPVIAIAAEPPDLSIVH